MAAYFIAPFVGGAVLGAARGEIAGIIRVVVDWVTDTTVTQIRINGKEDPKCRYALKEAMVDLDKSRFRARDGIGHVNWDLEDGNYQLQFLDYTINVSIMDDIITITSRLDSKLLKLFLDSIYSAYCAPDKVILYYGSKDSSWSFPVIRRARNFNNFRITRDMRDVLENIDQFYNSKNIYENNGWAYRKGYLLEGPSGTGKTTLVEIVATRYGRSVYRVTLKARHMTDEVLENLFATVPAFSLIIVDEFDKQLEQNTTVTPATILSAIDGPERLSHGTIVILTANRFDHTTEFAQSLLRRGRIDEHIYLNEILI